MPVSLKPKRIKLPHTCTQVEMPQHKALLAELRGLIKGVMQERELVWFLRENRAKTGEWMLAPFEDLGDLRLMWLRPLVRHWEKGLPRILEWLRENPVDGDWI